MSDNLYYVSDYQPFIFYKQTNFLQMETQVKKIPASADDALEVANTLNQMKRTVYQAIEAREWKSMERANLVSVTNAIERTVHEMITFYFGADVNTK